MKRALMIAEKPSVAWTVSHILSGGSGIDVDRSSVTPVHYFYWDDYDVMFTSVTGHIYEMKFPPKYESWSVDTQELFTCPVIQEPIDKDMVEHIRCLGREADVVYLWMDNDREGECICFEVMNIIKGSRKLTGNFFKRVVISALTKPEILKAVQNPRTPNPNEYAASLARQELDLRIGFAMTRVLTRTLRTKFKHVFGDMVSFGLCQTPALSLCVESSKNMKMLEISDGKKSTTVQCLSSADNKIIPSDLLNVQIKRRRVVTRAPPLPLDTISLLKYASKLLKFSPPETMDRAERLYLSGLISYPRTETSVYNEELDVKEPIYKLSSFNSKAAKLLTEGEPDLTHAFKDGVDTGAHVPIIPIVSRGNFTDVVSGLQHNDKLLYDLICSVYLASISSPAQIEITDYELRAGKCSYYTQGRKIISKGYLDYFKDIKEISLPLSKGSWKISSVSATAIDESLLIEEMQKKEIGTAASLSTHIDTLYKRNYCNSTHSRKVRPTRKGECLIYALRKVDPKLVNTEARSNIEKDFDKIAKGGSRSRVVSKYIREYSEKVKLLEANEKLLIGSVKEYLHSSRTH